jgi:signal transduction histidine kinase
MTLYYAGLNKGLDNLKDASASLQSELKRLSPLRAIRGETETTFGIAKAIGFVMEVFRSRLEKAGIAIEVNAKEAFMLHARYGAVIQIFSNLLDNSCYWLGMVPRNNRKVKVLIDPKYRTVIVADSGPGIDSVVAPYLFQPGYSMRIPPSGLGLYIVRYYMQSMKGTAYSTPGRERIQELPGAQFTLDFCSVPSERPVREAKK